jgi:hypothetical protein
VISQRHRPVIYAVAAIVVIWLLAVAGYQLARHLKLTAEKVRAYEESVDLARLSGADRERALHKLEGMLNGLTLEERRQVWGEILARWFAAMTEAEKGDFLEATMPTGFKQMIGAFEALPPDRRQKTIENTLKNLRESQAEMQAGIPPKTALNNSTNQPVLSQELQDKITTIGLKSYYTQSSPETRAELAPVLEEMQNVMELSRKNNGP